MARGCRTVVLTLGADGAFIVTATSVSHVPAPKVARVVDTVGAGDAFVGALALYLARAIAAKTDRGVDSKAAIAAVLSGSELAAAVTCGAAVASDSVQRKGTQKSYPFLKDLPHAEALFSGMYSE